MRIQMTVALGAGVFLAALALNTSAPLAQQHSYTPLQIEEGRKLYEANCGRCHGDNGSGIPNADLFKQIRRATTDEDIAKLIQTGIQGTAMPPTPLTTEQAMNTVAFLRSLVGVAPAAAGGAGGTTRSDAMAGDPARGKAIFTGKGGCTGCHMAEGAGGTTGPNLSAIGAARGRGAFTQAPNPAALERSILDTNAEIAIPYRMYELTAKTGALVSGRLLNQDTFSVQLMDGAGNLRSFLKSDLKQYGFLPSAMPSYKGRFTPQELADVVSYLLTLTGQ
jgi:putative heme-binding domain-containing protein